MLRAIPSRRELLAWILVGVLAVTSVAVLLRPGPVDAAPGSIPLSGRTVAYLATGTNFPDALGAAPAAAVGLGPILLVQQNSIPQPTLDELNRIQPKEIFIMGGTGVISDAVKAQVQALPWSHTTTRVSGNDRYGTAAALSALTFPTTGFYPRVSHASSNDLPNGNGNDQALLTTVIVAEKPGTLVLHGGAEYVGQQATYLSCWFEVNSVPVIGSQRDIYPGYQVVDIHDGGSTTYYTNTEENCETEGALDLPAGTYVVSMLTDAETSIGIYGGTLIVEWLPFDGFGS